MASRRPGMGGELHNGNLIQSSSPNKCRFHFGFSLGSQLGD